ncbi:HABP4 PAI-RBP1 domain containing protein [Trichuris trichiura]|uniref:HABP4 PAI-RBP1 domain containing protein n=1 Tax=Trichuris trichiura TaxID=36087 RepID=A0A077Z3M3_TRITR|nr:HABP4 PAI-RBP1 domain containing protein [Trichuris trichiura]
MEPEYGVNVSNKFAALGDDDLDPFDLLALYVEKNAKSNAADKKKSKKVEEKVAATAPDRNVVSLNLEKSAPPGRHEKVSRAAKVTEGDRRVKTTAPATGIRQRFDLEAADPSAKQRSQTERHLNGNKADNEKVDSSPFGEFGRSRARGRPRARGPRINRGTLRGALSTHDAAITDSNDKYGDSLSPVRNDDVMNYKNTVMRTGPRNGRQRGGRGRIGPVRGRQFDRQSGMEKSRVRPTDKRDGAGQYNWGTAADELVGETEELTTDQTVDTDEAPNKDSNLNLTESEETTDGAPKERVEELTLDEWKAKQAPRTKPQFNTRKPGEGDTNATWTTLVPLQRDQIGKNESNEDEFDDEPQPRHRKKEVIDIGFSFRDDGTRSQRRFGRGVGRGSYRGVPRSRGGRRGYRGSALGSGVGRGFGSYSSSDGGFATGGGDGFRNGTLDKSSGGESDIVGSAAAATKEDRMGQESLFDAGSNVTFGRKSRVAGGGGGGFGRSDDTSSYRVPYNLDEESFPELPTSRH